VWRSSTYVHDGQVRADIDAGYQADLYDTIVFWGHDGKTRVRCRIERNALDDHFSDGGRLRPKAAFEKHRADIEALSRRKYLIGQREPDGSVLIRTADVA
jgi:hypothetical protein